jgi:hypothetical protein
MSVNRDEFKDMDRAAPSEVTGSFGSNAQIKLL